MRRMEFSDEESAIFRKQFNDFINLSFFINGPEVIVISFSTKLFQLLDCMTQESFIENFIFCITDQIYSLQRISLSPLQNFHTINSTKILVSLDNIYSGTYIFFNH